MPANWLGEALHQMKLKRTKRRRILVGAVSTVQWLHYAGLKVLRLYLIINFKATHKSPEGNSIRLSSVVAQAVDWRCTAGVFKAKPDFIGAIRFDQRRDMN